ncbi:MAG: radical SAM protein [Spirochaetes bacterium]|nr:radical SAM protein [Spirochaetota bacterium]
MFGAIDILDLKPFEICSIRPPTENFSLTFRLTRNCYWNKCAFCPVYKLGARYSKRSIEEVVEDIRRAQMLDDFMFQRGFGNPVYTESDYGRVPGLADEITAAHWAAGIVDENRPVEAPPEGLDTRMAWFMSWFNSRPDIPACISHILAWRINGGATCFLGDADSLNLKPSFLSHAIKAVKTAFPSIRRFTVYGRTSTAARMRSVNELRAFAEAGLNRVHFGLESGCDRVLAFVDKGVSADEHVEGCLKTKEAGLSCSVYVMPGLGGSGLSAEHARDTAALLTRIAPDFIRLRSLEVFPGTGLEAEIKKGSFTEAGEEQVVREIRTIVAETDAETELLSDSASNLLGIFGRLPDDRPAILREIDDYLALDPREKLEFSLHSRLRSFAGQYGGISGDIFTAIEPFIRGGKLAPGSADDRELERLILLIRSKLMP